MIKIVGLDKQESLVVGKPIAFYLDTRDSGEIQLDSITIFGPKKANGKSSRDDQTILGRIKSISSSSSSSINQNLPLEYSLKHLDEHRQEIKFIPQVVGKYSIDIRCLGQPVGSSPYEIEARLPQQDQKQLYANSHAMNKNKTLSSSLSSSSSVAAATTATAASSTPSGVLASNATPGTVNSKEDELLRNIVVHGIGLKCSPVNSTGAFIIETNRLAQARDFDVLITDPNNSLVDVQCYLQQDGNLLAQWTPRRVGEYSSYFVSFISNREWESFEFALIVNVINQC